MGCCFGSSFAPIPGKIDQQVFGVATQIKFGRYFNDESAEPNTKGPEVTQPAGAQVPKPSPTGALLGKEVPWCGFELGYNWAAGRGGAKVRVSMGASKWNKGDANMFNSALMSNEQCNLCCGREEVLFAGKVGPVKGPVGLVVLSTGMVMVLGKKYSAIQKACHVFDLKGVSGTAAGEVLQVAMDFGDRFPKAPGCAHSKNTSIELEMTKSQAADLVTALRLVHLAYWNAPLNTTVPQECLTKISTPTAPCDGGFHMRLLALCSYAGVSLREFTVGEPYYAGVPVLELDISGFKPVSSRPQWTWALFIAMESSSFGFRAFRAEVAGNPLSQSEMQNVLGGLTSGQLMKVHMPMCMKDPGVLTEFVRALAQRKGASYIVDYDLSGCAFNDLSVDAFADVVSQVVGGVRSLALADCQIRSGPECTKLMQAIGKNSKLWKLVLTNNKIGSQADPHPLSPVWSPSLEILRIGGTGMDFAKLVNGVDESKVRSLRVLDISNLAFPAGAKDVVEKFFSSLGGGLEVFGFGGFAKDSQQLGMLLSALARTPKPNLKIDLSSVAHAEALRGVTLANGKMPKGGLTLGPGDLAPELVPKMWFDSQVLIQQQFLQGKAKGMTGSALNAEVGKAIQTFLPSMNRMIGQQWMDVGKALMMLDTQSLKFAAPEREPQAWNWHLSLGDISYAVPSDHTYFSAKTYKWEMVSMKAEDKLNVGAGPLLALAIPGLAENKSILSLDCTGAMGGDAVAIAIGNMLKTNRTIRSLHLELNCYTHFGWGALRSAFYGNKKILQVTTPAKSTELFAKVHTRAIKAMERVVFESKANIKRAFKSTKGRRSPYVVKVLNENVAKISEAKKGIALIRVNFENFSKNYQGISEALLRNQNEAKNHEWRRNAAKVHWKTADKLLSNIDRLSNQQKAVQNSQEFELWNRRQAMVQMWAAKIKELKGKKKDVSWYEIWEKANTKKGSVVMTAEGAEGLLRLVPADLNSQVKEEVKKTKEFVKSEDRTTAQARAIESKIQENQVEVARLQASVHWSPPPSNAKGISADHVKKLQAPVLAGAVVPPASIVQGKILEVRDDGPWGADPNQTVTGTVVGAAPAGSASGVQLAPVVAVIPPSGPQTNAQYDQFQVYQQKQFLYRQKLVGRMTSAPAEVKTANRDGPRGGMMLGAAGAGLAGGAAAAGIGMWAYNWHNQGGQDHFRNYLWWKMHHDPSWRHRYHDPGYYGDTGHYGYDYDGGYGGDCVPGTDDCGWAAGYAEAPEAEGGCFADGAPPEGFSADGPAAEAVVEAGETVDMYAGGEDDRPGKGPHGGSGSHAAKAWEPEPPWLTAYEDLMAMFEKGQKEARESIIGRIGPLPCRRELLVRTGGTSVDGGVCLVTQCSTDRLDRLCAQMIAWEGEVAAAVYIEAAPESLEATRARQAILEACGRAAAEREAEGCAPPLWTIVAVYALEDCEVRCEEYDKLYPVNTLRNAALEAARADLVFLLDVDFLPAEGLHGLLCGEDRGERLCQALRGSEHCRPTALVVPAFEATQRGAPLPREGRALREAEELSEVEAFHVGHFPKGHRATDFARWLRGSPVPAAPPAPGRLLRAADGVDAYPVVYEESFEPYIVAAKELVPAYDERFRGYGMNKISHLYSVHAHGFKFCTMDHGDAFVVAGKHPKSKSWRVCVGPDADAEQRARISMHFAYFKHELGQQLPTLPVEAPLAPASSAPRCNETQGPAPWAGASAALWLPPAACARSTEELAALLPSEAALLAEPAAA